MYMYMYFQWITSCNKSVITTRVLTLLLEYVTSLTTSVTTKDDVRNNNVNFHWIYMYVYFKRDKIVFKKSYDKMNLTLMVISYEINSISRRLV